MALRPGVTAVIPAHPPRLHGGHLYRAVASVAAQTWMVDAISVAVDLDRDGAAVTRNRALAAVHTEWSAFLDSDDEWMPHHVEKLLGHAKATGADLVYPWFDVVNGFDPFPRYEGQPFNEHALRHAQNYIPVTVLARTELLRDSGGFQAADYDASDPNASACDDHGAWINLLDAGATFSHLNRRTWIWRWSSGPGGNTSGRPDRW